MTIFDEQLQIFKILEPLVTRALRDYMKLDKTNVTITRGYMYLFYTNDSKVLFPSVKEIIRRLKIVASGERLTDQDAEYFDWEEYGSLEMQRIYFSEIIKREAKTT